MLLLQLQNCFFILGSHIVLKFKIPNGQSSIKKGSIYNHPHIHQAFQSYFFHQVVWSTCFQKGSRRDHDRFDLVDHLLQHTQKHQGATANRDGLYKQTVTNNEAQWTFWQDINLDQMGYIYCGQSKMVQRKLLWDHSANLFNTLNLTMCDICEYHVVSYHKSQVN